MKRLLIISNILSWIILIIGCIFLLFGLLAAMTTRDMRIFTAIVILAAIPLHAYAALQLRKSIMNENIPLGGQTRFGLRTAGFVALFLGFMGCISGYSTLTNSGDVLQQVYEAAPQLKNIYTKNTVITIGIIDILFCLLIVINVIINLRLLRWYLYQKQHSNTEK